MFIIEKTIDIDAPAAVVWEVLTDLPRYGEWNPFQVSVKSTLKPGDAIDMQVALMAKPQRQVEWMKEYVEGRRFAYCMKPVPGGALSSFRSHDVEPLPNNRTRYRSYFHLQGWLKPVVLMLFRKNLERGFAGASAGVQRQAESLWAARRGAR
ncbi:MAG TPA: SRPBCC domain-containing protein [Nevskiaceae bacterium]|nr:SRPBCC domain-containing protein [Nevskiaceae bacterium]